jgi:hypothetical protein
MSSPAVRPPAAEAAAEQQLREARLCLQQATEEMKAFQIVERFLSGVERAILGRVSPPFESRPVTDALQALDLAIRAADVPRLEAALKLFAGEFDVWRAAITRRDAQLSPFDLRRFCERGDVSLDPQTFAALTRFYRACPRSEAAQSKYDFVVTRLFTRTEAHHRRALRLGSDRLAVSLAKMCAAWGETIRADAEGAQLPEARRQFDAFIAEAAALTRLEDWVAADLFGRLRAFKLGLGAAFYAPEITAAAISCNVAVASRFSALLAVESEQVRNAPAACQALSDLFSNTSDGVPDHVREALAELGSSEVNADVAAAERLQRLARLLQIASPRRRSRPGAWSPRPPTPPPRQRPPVGRHRPRRSPHSPPTRRIKRSSPITCKPRRECARSTSGSSSRRCRRPMTSGARTPPSAARLSSLSCAQTDWRGWSCRRDSRSATNSKGGWPNS